VFTLWGRTFIDSLFGLAVLNKSSDNGTTGTPPSKNCNLFLDSCVGVVELSNTSEICLDVTIYEAIYKHNTSEAAPVAWV